MIDRFDMMDRNQCCLGPPKGPLLGTKFGNRSTQKGAKGSALLNQNNNANQVAICHACGTKIR